MSNNIFDNADIISTYTRQQAIEDGIFVDVTDQAKQQGFKIPVALTTNLYTSFIKSDNNTATNLTAFLHRLYQEILANAHKRDSMIVFKVKFDGKTPTEIWAVVEAQSPTDPSPAMNVMLPEDY